VHISNLEGKRAFAGAFVQGNFEFEEIEGHWWTLVSHEDARIQLNSTAGSGTTFE
jgi:hypothetical protein